MKIRVMSDLHLDVNEEYPLILPKDDKDTFTILAGDISGEMDMGIFWVKDNCPYGVCIAGNHLVYNDYGKSLQDLKDTLKMEFPEACTMRYLENDCVVLPKENLVIVGATLYSNFTLNGLDQNKGKAMAEYTLNDFRWGHYYDDDTKSVRRLRADDYLKMFNESLAYIAKVADENPDKDIIVVTHHAPSGKSVASRYRGEMSNCAYASDLDDFIKAHKNIKLWIHGHTHTYFDYKVGGCRVFCNPRGYVRYGEDYGWNPLTYVDTKTWKVSSDKSWFNRDMSDDEKKNREDLDKAYETLFRAL